MAKPISQMETSVETEKDDLQGQEKNQESNDKILSAEEKIDLIENQLHVINTMLHSPEKKHWWKQNISLFISIIAFMASIGFNYYGVIRDKFKDSQTSDKEKAIAKAKKIEEINQLILKLTYLQGKNIKLASENPNVDVNSLSVLSNYERLIYVNKILNLIDSLRLGTKFPPEVYALIGNELRYDGQFAKAKTFYFDELHNANTATARVVANRDLANIFGIPETGFQDIDSSRRYWRNSILISDSIIGEQKYHYKGYGYQLWAGNEFYFGDSKLAMELIDSAKQSYSKLPGGNTAKEYNIRRLNQMVEFYNSRNVNSRLHSLAGEWMTTGEPEAKVNFYQNMNGVFCNFEFYELGVLSYNLTGPFISMARNHMTFNVQGVKRFYPGMVTASVRFYPHPDKEGILYVSFNELSEKERKFTIFKK